MRFAGAILLSLSGAHAAFEHILFHPIENATYSFQGVDHKPRLFAFEPSTRSLYHSVGDFDYFVNGVKQETEWGLEKLRSTRQGLFYSLQLPPGHPDKDRLIGYGVHSSDESVGTVVGGGVGEFRDIVGNRFSNGFMPVEHQPGFRGVFGTDADAWPVDEGFETYDEIPHTSGPNRFANTVAHGLVNSRAICAVTTTNKYVCTGDASLRDAWNATKDVFLDISDDPAFSTCATDDQVFILYRGQVYWVSATNDTLPNAFSEGGVSSIGCTKELFYAKTTHTSELHIINPSTFGMRTIANVSVHGHNRDSVMYRQADSEEVMHVVDLAKPGFKFTSEVQDPSHVLANFYSYGIHNGSSLEVYFPRTAQHFLSDDVRLVHTCADGLYLYLENNSTDWKVWGPTNRTAELQALLDTRVVLDISITDEYGCMLLKMTDAETGRNFTVPDYGDQSDNNGSIDAGAYSDQRSDVVAVVLTSIALFIASAFSLYWRFRV